MIASKFATRFVILVVAILVCVCLGLIFFSDKLGGLTGPSKTIVQYENEIFNTEKIVSVNIIMDDESWKDMLENALSEKYYRADVEINGELFQGVGIRPKGNTSLSSIANDPDTNRYSFKIEFDKFVEGQSYYGLDKLILNNSFADNTNMKEALIYDMYKFIGADAPIYNYAKISVNGNYWGVYLALEAIEDSFLLRNYGTASGELYKPDGLNFGGGGGGFGGMNIPNFNSENFQNGNFSPPQFNGKAPQEFNFENGVPNFENGGPPQGFNFENGVPNFENGMPSPENFQNGNQNFERANGESQNSNREMRGPMGGMSGSGANLNYIDENIESYSTIWNGSVTDSNNFDHTRVVTALKNISEENNIEKYMDVENLTKYMAVHIFSVNEDSLSGSMAHNYYLHEYNEKLNIIPWDYNLIFGGMNRGDATSIINDPIDNAFSITNFFNPLLTNRKYLTMYYENLTNLVEKYINGGEFEKFYNRTRNLIDSLVKTDPNAFVDYETYDKAAKTLYEVVKLRGQSILGQINEEIPSTSEKQKSNPENLIDASHIDVKSMGSMNIGMGRGNRENNFGNLKNENSNNNIQNMPPTNVNQNNTPSEKNPNPLKNTENTPPTNTKNTNDKNTNFQNFNRPEGMNRNQMMNNSQSGFLNKYFTIISTSIIFLVGFVFIILYKRKLF